MNWIKCEDQLPEEGETVICYCVTIVLGFYVIEKIPQERHKKGWNLDWPNDRGELKKLFKKYPVTHWMKLPKHPE